MSNPTRRMSSEEDTSRNPSGFFGKIPIDSIRNGLVDGTWFDSDFAGFKHSANINAAEAYWDQGFKVFGSDGAAIALADEIGGAITLSSDGDNEGVGLGQNGFSFQISLSHGDLAFEVRLKTSTISDTKHGFFVGLVESLAMSATVPIAAAGTLTDNNFVGFHRLEGDGDYVDCVYKANGVTQVTVQADAKVLVADTYVRLGMFFNSSTGVLTYYSNGLPIATKTIPSAAGTDFPNDVRLGCIFALLNATGTTPGNTTIDRIMCYQKGA